MQSHERISGEENVTVNTLSKSSAKLRKKHAHAYRVFQNLWLFLNTQEKWDTLHNIL